MCYSIHICKGQTLNKSVTPICYWVGVLGAGGMEMGLALISINRVNVKIHVYVLYWGKMCCLNIYILFSWKRLIKINWDLAVSITWCPSVMESYLLDMCCVPKPCSLKMATMKAAWPFISQQGSVGRFSLAEGRERLCDHFALILVQFGPKIRECPQQKHMGLSWCAEPLNQQS